MRNISLQKSTVWIGISVFTILFWLSAFGCFAQSIWTNVGSTLQMKVTGTDTLYRFPKSNSSMYGAPFAASSELAKKLNIKDSVTKYVTPTQLNAAIVGATIPDATTTIKGKLKLAGDLSGTADLPSVPGLALKVDKSQLSEGASVNTIPLRKSDGRVEVGTAIDGADAVNKTQFDGALDLKVNKTTTITGGGGIVVGGDLSTAISLSLDETYTNNRYLKKTSDDDNGTNKLTLGSLETPDAEITNLKLPSLGVGSIAEPVLTVGVDGLIKKTTLGNISYNVANAAGTTQFPIDNGQSLRFAGSGDTDISYNAATKTVTINSIPGAGGGGAVTSFNGRTGGVVSTDGDYSTDQVTEGTNKYFTEERVRGAPLTGLTAGNGNIAPTDNILQAFGKLQAQSTSHVNSSRNLTVSGTSGRIIASGGTQNLTADREWTLDLASSGVTSGTYKSVTTDAYGRVISGSNPTTLGGFGITDAYTKTETDAKYYLNTNPDGFITSSSLPDLTPYALKATTITAGTGLTGGGDLSTNRTVSANFGTSAGTIAQGNDSRINNGQTAFGWGNHAGLYPTYNGTGAAGIWSITSGNSLLLNGAAGSVAGTASTLALRDGSGNLQSNFLQDTHGTSDNVSLGYLVGKNDANNGYQYTFSKSFVQPWLDINNGATLNNSILGNAATASSVTWTNVTGKPTIPTNTSQLTNDSDFATNASVETKIPLAEKGSANGVATLDAGGKVLSSQLPSGSQVFKGAWNASTNTPSLSDGVGTVGWTYRVTVGGTRNLGSGSIVWNVGSDVVYNGTVWEQFSSGVTVTSVNSKVGDVILSVTDIVGAANINGANATGTWPIAITGSSMGLGNYNWTGTVKSSADFLYGRDNANEIAIINGDGVASVFAGKTLNNSITGSSASASSVPWTGVTGKPTFATVAISGSYSDLSGTPTIPTNTNQLTNGAGFITSSALSPYQLVSGLGSNAFTSTAYLPLSGGDITGTTTVRMNAPASSVALDVGGWVRGLDFIVNSDSVLKKNITPLKNSISKLGNLNGYSYDWKRDGSHTIGIIAQEIQKEYPEIVHKDEKGILNVDYSKLVAPLIQANNEQQKEIDQLKKDIQELKSLIKR